MKANEAPEKVYFNPLLMEDGESIVRVRTFERQSDSQIEYTRTDAFIEKASKWLSKHAIKYYLDGSKFLGTDELVEDFKIAMTL